MWLIAAALGGSATYNTDEVTVDVEKMSLSQMRSSLQARLRKFTVQWRDPETGQLTEIGAGAEKMPYKHLDRPALLALVLGMDEAGKALEEYDLVFRDQAGDLRPVTVWVDGPAALTVSQGDAIATIPAGPPIEQLVARYALLPAVEHDAIWESKVRGALDTALRHLDRGELAAIADVTLVRKGGPERHLRSAHPAGSVNTANYIVQGAEAEIEIYDEAVMETGRFVGPVGAPEHPTVFILLHELGHAIADHPARALAREYQTLLKHSNTQVLGYNADLKRLNRMIDDHNAGGSTTLEQISRLESEVIRNEVKVMADKASVHDLAARLTAHEKVGTSPLAVRFLEETECEPTSYSKTSADEAFAESFALYKLDPEALKRISVRGFDWFAAGKHTHQR